MSISFIAIHSYILKYVAPRGQNTLRWALYPTLPYHIDEINSSDLASPVYLIYMCFQFNVNLAKAKEAISNH